MTPLLHSFIEPGKTKAILYVIDSSSPETLGAATIYLVELMAQPGLESSQVREELQNQIDYAVN